MKAAIILALAALACAVSASAGPGPCTEEVGTAAHGLRYVIATPALNVEIKPGQCLISPNQRYMLLMQADDGNLVLYDRVNAAKYKATWDARTAGNPGASTLVQQDGHFVVYRKEGIFPGPNGAEKHKLFESNAPTGFGWFFLAMQNDGNLVLYEGNNIQDHSRHRFDTQSIINRRSLPLGPTSCMIRRCSAPFGREFCDWDAKYDADCR